MSDVAIAAQGLVRRFRRSAGGAQGPLVDLGQGKGGDLVAVDGLSFEVAAGELYGLVGPDGAGKTTTVRLLAGLLDPDEGTARVLGGRPATTAVRESLGLMPQQHSLYGDLSIAENLRFFGHLFCIPRAEYRRRVERLLHITRLAPFVDRRADALSGGMYKKLALACALLHEPRVLLLDEPTNGVDPVSRRELWDLLYEFVGGGMAVLVCTPYMDEAARCHRTGLLHRGRLIAEGEPRALVSGFEHETWVIEGGDRGAVHAVLEGRTEVIAASPAGPRLRAVVRRGASGAVGQALGEIGARLVPARPDFEDLYLARMAAAEAA